LHSILCESLGFAQNQPLYLVSSCWHCFGLSEEKSLLLKVIKGNLPARPDAARISLFLANNVIEGYATNMTAAAVKFCHATFLQEYKQRGGNGQTASASGQAAIQSGCYYNQFAPFDGWGMDC
jgi:hypothetical protein